MGKNGDHAYEFPTKEDSPAHGTIPRQGAVFRNIVPRGAQTIWSNRGISLWLTERLRQDADRSDLYVHAYCIMPDHVHLLAAGASKTSDLTAFVASFKKETGFEFEKKTGRRLWQFKYYDRILRGNDSANRVAWYIWLNPVRKGLCRERHEYPFAGSFTEIGKKMFSGAAPPEWSPPWKREKVSNES